MRIAAVQINPIVGNLSHNTTLILDGIRWAKEQLANLVVFPELALTGYPPLDLLDIKGWHRELHSANDQIAAAASGISVLYGAPSKNEGVGRTWHNSAILAENGSWNAVYHKRLLPTYDIFDEDRYYTPGTSPCSIQFEGKSFFITICEDVWFDDKRYTHNPMDDAPADTDLVINLSASPFAVGKDQRRLKALTENVLSKGLPVLYVNQVGANTELLFDGRTELLAADGSSIGELKAFEPDFGLFELSYAGISALNCSPAQPPMSAPEEHYRGLVMGIRDFFTKNGFKKGILGLSGGVDSALVAVLACDAIGPENVHCVLLPSKYSSDHSISDSIDLVKNLGCSHDIVSIQPSFDAVMEMVKPAFDGLPFSLAEENMQSRLRGVTLMAYSNKFGYILLNTSNKSELAVGYGTLYGDMNGGIGIIGDLFKTEVYALCDYINRDKEIIPTNILTKAPSAELRPDQKDSDSLPEYDLLDAVLKSLVVDQKTKAELLTEFGDESLINRISTLVERNEYKRFQAPPQLRVSEKAFGYGRRMPLVGKLVL